MKRRLKPREVVIPPSEKQKRKFDVEKSSILFNLHITGFGDINGNKSISCDMNGDATQMIEGLTRVFMSDEKMGDILKVAAAMFILSTTKDEDIASQWLNGKGSRNL